MSNEDLNKKIEFIIEHQAKFAAEIEMLREVQATDTKLLKEQDRRLADALLGTITIVGNIAEAQLRTDESLRILTTQTEQGIKQLTEAQLRTDERLNIFINVVERYMSGNGGSERHA